jgi:menaquinone-9 beta-reductase
MEWIWQIPIHADTISVGYVSTGDAIKEKRRQGLNIQQIFAAKLEDYPDLRGLCPQVNKKSARTTSFRCRAFVRTAGPNWLVVGEAAAMVDPMTSNGVTAALRHAAEASRLIIRFRDRKRIPSLSAFLYSQRVLCMARFFNSAIEDVLYDSPVRRRIGPFKAGDVYTIPAWSMNVAYSRLRPDGFFSTFFLRSLLASIRRGLSVFHWLCRRSESVALATAPSTN